MNKNKIVILIAVLVTIAGGCFYSGVLYEKNVTKQNIGLNRNQQNMLQNIKGENISDGIKNNNANIGEIISKDQESITIKLMNGSSKIIFLSASAQVSKNINIDIEELEIGQNVAVQGMTNSDNSITAKSIQIMDGSQNKMNMLK
jgi:hypothetical protein